MSSDKNHFMPRAFMVWYVAITAILNLGLGYVLAVFLGAGRAPIATTTGGMLDDTEYSDADGEV
jgi:hypothetical protein